MGLGAAIGAGVHKHKVDTTRPGGEQIWVPPGGGSSNNFNARESVSQSKLVVIPMYNVQRNSSVVNVSVGQYYFHQKLDGKRKGLV